MIVKEILTLIAENISKYACTTLTAEQKLQFCEPRGNEYRYLSKKISCSSAKREALEELMDKVLDLYGEEILSKGDSKMDPLDQEE